MMSEIADRHVVAPLEEQNHTGIIIDARANIATEVANKFSEFIDLHVIAPSEKHTHTCILLHGLGSIATEFANEFLEGEASDDRTLPEIFPTVKWVFPTSKELISARFETELPQWFDIWSMQKPQERQESQVDGLRDSISYLLTVLDHEASFVPSQRIILGGFDQGSATAIQALLISGMPFGGFIGLSSWLPFRDDTLNASKFILNRALETPVFLSHCRDDEVVPIVNGEEMREDLKRLGMDVTWKAYEDGGHDINERDGVDDIVNFVLSRVYTM